MNTLEKQQSSLIASMWRRYVAVESDRMSADDNLRGANICYTAKQTPLKRKDGAPVNYEDRKEFGYYINPDLMPLLRAISFVQEKLNNSDIRFLDIGCGMGHVLYAVEDFLRDAASITHGIENEPLLVNAAKKKDWYRGRNVYRKDFFRTTKAFMEKYNVFYFWEPMSQKDSAEKFVKKLVNVLPTNAFIIYKPSGHIHRFLTENKRFELLGEKEECHGGLLIYQFK